MTPVAFEGQIAVVTGAGGGLGAEYAQALARRGCQVVVNDVPGGGARHVVDLIVRQGGIARACEADLTRNAAVPIDAALEQFGRIDIVINNAGATGGGSIDVMPEADFDRLMDVNVRASVGVIRAAWPHLSRQRYGRIVNTSSGSVLGLPGCFAYQTSKAALIGLTRALALDGDALGIRVNAVSPIAYTRMTADIPDPAFRGFLQDHFPPAAAAPFVVALCSRNVPCTGELFSVGGGIAARIALGFAPGHVMERDSRPEAWLQHFARILATDELQVARTAMDEIAFRASQLGAQLADTHKAADWSRPAAKGVDTP